MKRSIKVMLMVLLAIAVCFVALACFGNSGNNALTINPGDGAQVDLGERIGALTEEEASNLILNWAEVIEKGNYGSFRSYTHWKIFGSDHERVVLSDGTNAIIRNQSNGVKWRKFLFL